MVRLGAQRSAFAILGAVVAFGAHASAQERVGSIRGLVTDRELDVAVGGVQVTVVETGRKITTTETGNYVLNELPAGVYTLVFAKDGFVRQVKADVVVQAGLPTDLDIALSGDFTDMEEFVAQDALQLGGGTETSLLQLRYQSASLLDSIGSDLMSKAGASDAAGALRLVSGASVKDGKSAVIRGLPDRYVSSQLNGVRLPSADDDKRAVELDQFPAAIIESIRVSKTFTPDQMGDASGGAVDVRLRGIPDEPFFLNVRGESSFNSQVRGRTDFLSYDGGGVSYWGEDDGRREQQLDSIGENWDGAVGVSRTDAPDDYKWSAALGSKIDLGDGWKVGGFVSFFYERDSSFYDNGKDDEYWVDTPGAGMTPEYNQGTPQDGEFKTALFDVTQASQSVQWGGLATIGVESRYNALNLVYLQSRTAEDTATLAEDTRGKEYYFPGYDPDDPSTPGHDQPDAAPYLRLETLEYTERTTGTLQFNGHHELDFGSMGPFGNPEVDWTVSRSDATSYQPDKRQFGSLWLPGRQRGPLFLPAEHYPYKPGANFTLGNLQRIWKDIKEESNQYAIDLKVPFGGRKRDEGYLKFGMFRDRVHREFDQDTYSNFNDNSSYKGDYDDYWSRNFPYENHPISESTFDVDYTADQEVAAWYGMVDLPLASTLNLIGGARFESTRISIQNDPEEDATWFPKGSFAPTKLNPGDADVDFDQDDVLPAIGLVYRPARELTFRASYAQTVARQTFKELTPILQQEFLGGPIFIGNPDLQMSALDNYDLRADWAPHDDSLLSVSWFKKDIEMPIEYVQRLTTFTYTTAENYPEGELHGFELEARQGLGRFWDPLEGLAVGANATFIESDVYLPDDEADGFEKPNIQAPMRSRDMTNAPEHLYNLYLTYTAPWTGTSVGLFYTVQGDTLVAGAAESNGNYVPNVYAREFDTLNLSVTQPLGDWVKLQFKAKNLTNPAIETVYRSPYIGDDVVKTSYTQGVEYAIGIGGEIKF